MRLSFPLVLVLCLAASLGAAPVPLKYTRIDLSDGRSLMNVVIKSYDPATGKLLLVADGRVLLIPVKLVQQPFRDKLMAEAPKAGATNSVVPGQAPPPKSRN